MKTVIERLASIASAQWITTDPAVLDTLSWDALSEGRVHPLRSIETNRPACAVFPGSVDEVRRIVLLANEQKIPIIPYGGGSGLMGAALSVKPGIVVDLRRMNQPLEIDIAARSARVQAGIVLEALEQRLNEQNFILGHDPWTLPVATVGGAISTASVGYRAGVYGSMGEQVLGLEAVMANGEILRKRAVPKSSTGPDLRLLLIGGEGCFGIVTEATLRIFPKPAKRVLRGLLFESFESGFDAIQKLFAACLRPALLDFGDDDEKSTRGAVLYIGFEGAVELVTAEDRIATDVLLRNGGKHLPTVEAETFWDNRHAIARRFLANRSQRRKRGSDGIYRDWIHVALPASKVLAFRRAAMVIIEQHGVDLHESGLWIQPELFSMRLGIDDHGKKQAQLALQQTVDDLLGLAQDMGGSMEYTHGVGVKLAPFMLKEHGYGLEVMRSLKKTLDPNNIMNPAKMSL
ncbi:MAG TPA: FAD-binding oxidoreductase [Candidatus Binatia bacterium]|nr:FAD-binding oxidoreductase [Candidatus Binatia bacterium]